MKKICYLLAGALLLASCGKRLHFQYDGSYSDYYENGKLIQVSSHDTTGGNNDRVNLKPGEAKVIADVDGPGIFTRMWVTTDADFTDRDYLRNILIRIYWDGEENPSVEVPLGDFFGNAFAYRHHLPMYVGMSSGGYYCYFPMPFNKHARIEVVNQADTEVLAFYYNLDYFKLDRPFKKNTPYFHAQWNREVKTDTPEDNYLILDAEGKGYFVGMNLHAQPYRNTLEYLEGDEMAWVDGEEYPSIYGTGAEDYFTSGWYFKNGEYSAPFHGLTSLDKSNGRVVAYRHHIKDPIPFKKSLKFTIEHGSENEAIGDFASTAYWYQAEPHKPFGETMKPGLRRVLRRMAEPGSVDAAKAAYTGAAPAATVDMSDFGAEWVNNDEVQVAGKPGDSFTLTLPGLIEKAYNVTVYYSQGAGYADADVYANGKKVGTMTGAATGKPVPAPALVLKDLPSDSDRKIELTFRFKTEGKVGIDAFFPDPVREYITDWYFIGPFGYPRVSDTERAGLDSVYMPEKEIDLKATYTGAGEQPLTWKRHKKGAGYEMGLMECRPLNQIVCYALTYIYSPEAQTAPLLTGSDDCLKVFLNDQEVYRFFASARTALPDQDKIELNLQPGWNKLLVKVENNVGGYALYARVVDVNRNLKISPTQTK